MSEMLDDGSALIIVDMQNDFMPGGSLPVPDADKIIPIINKYIEIFMNKGLPIFASRDWHPPNHISFKQRGGVWPVHCVRNTLGAKFHPDLKLPRSTIIISKATDPNREAYSAFDRTELADRLREKSIKRVFIAGVATDYCVKNTALDALEHGFETILLEDATKGLANSLSAIEEMKARGVKVIRLEQLIAVKNR
ncbi:MAG: nicotinamidase [Candidatus Nitrosocaldus sp.]